MRYRSAPFLSVINIRNIAKGMEAERYIPSFLLLLVVAVLATAGMGTGHPKRDGKNTEFGWKLNINGNRFIKIAAMIEVDAVKC